MSNKKLETWGATFFFTQEADSCSDKWANGEQSAIQQIEVAIKDAGGGSYVVLKTDEWAVDSPAELGLLINKCVEAFKTAGGVY